AVDHQPPNGALVEKADVELEPTGGLAGMSAIQLDHRMARAVARLSRAVDAHGLGDPRQTGQHLDGVETIARDIELDAIVPWLELDARDRFPQRTWAVISRRGD